MAGARSRLFVTPSMVPEQFCSTRVQGPVLKTSGGATERDGWTLKPHTDVSATRQRGGLDSTSQVPVTSNKKGLPGCVPPKPIRIPGSSEGENGWTLFQVLQTVRLSQLLDEQLKFRIPLDREYM